MPGISGLGLATATVGGFLIYSSIENVTILDGLRQILKGQAIAPGPQTHTDVLAQNTAAETAGSVVGAMGNNVPVNGSTLDKLVAGIKIQESGGNYNVVNGIGAIGAYQVMPSNVASWTQQALGHSLTPAQFRASPAAQDAVAKYILGGYVKRFGLRGAAAAWYAGEGNAGLNESTASQSGGPSIKAYVDSVLANAGLG